MFWLRNSRRSIINAWNGLDVNLVQFGTLNSDGVDKLVSVLVSAI